MFMFTPSRDKYGELKSLSFSLTSVEIYSPETFSSVSNKLGELIIFNSGERIRFIISKI